MSLLDYISRLDVAALRAINHSGAHPWLDQLMAHVSDWSAARLPLLAVLLLVLWKGGLRARLFVLFSAAVILLGDVGICQPLKDHVWRARPYQVLDQVRIVSIDGVAMSPRFREHHISMPSSHAFNNIVFALLLVVFYGRWAHLAWLWALLMGYSRVYTGNHFPTDVLVGLLLGLGYGLAMVKLTRLLWRRLAPRLCPAWYARYPEILPPTLHAGNAEPQLGSPKKTTAPAAAD